MKRIWISIVAIVCIVIGFLSFTTYKNNFFEISKQLEIFIDLYKELNTNYVDNLVPSQVMEKAIQGVLTELDPYTVYRTEQQIIDARINHSGQYAGIGATIHFSGDKILLLECYENAPAAKAGLKAGDEIVVFNGTKISEITTDLQHNLLSGESGSEVSLTYIRDGKENKTTLTRERIERDAVPFYKLLDDNTGYIVLEAFNQKAASQTKSALLELKQKGADKIILDLRNNPGGLMNESIKIVNFFVDKGVKVTYTESVIQKYNTSYVTREEPIDTEIPLAILINERSASASEIIAGSLQDLDRAVIIGNQSFGKGLVQRELPLSYSTQLKVTISRYFTPSGRSIQKMDYDTDLVEKRNIQDKDQVFYTKNKRKVYGGGGIMPDKLLEENVDQDFIRDLKNNLHFFDFTSEYLKNKEKPNMDNFELTNTDWRNFKQFMRDREVFTKTMEAWKNFETIAKDETTESTLQTLEKEFNNQLGQVLDQKLDAHRKTIEQNLTDIIIRRTDYQNAAYNYAAKNNEVVLMAKNILNNKKEYQSILGI
ncbi:MAG TPA: S41 family peptidase [Flavobacteriaceae bacterium]|nr:S41 family peptidase [Flavobacteriaceae bacterium]